MTNKLNVLKKTIAIALATVFFSLPFADIASAAPKHEAPPPRHEQRVDMKHDKVHRSSESIVAESIESRSGESIAYLLRMSSVL